MIDYKNICVLIVDDEPLVCELLSAQLTELGFGYIFKAYDIDEGIEILKKEKVDIVLLDMEMSDPDTGQNDLNAGINFIFKMRNYASIPIVLVTAYSSHTVLEKAMEYGIGAYLVKPARKSDLERSIVISMARFQDMKKYMELSSTLSETNHHLQEEIKKRKEAEINLKYNEEKYENIIQYASDAIISIDNYCRINVFNPGAEKMFGYKSGDVFGKPVEMLLPQRFHRGLRTFLLHYNEHSYHKKNNIMVKAVRKSGEEFLVDISFSITLISGETLFTTISRDITERIRFEKTLKEAKEAAEEGNRVKSQFLATMSHEIRTPMNGIVGMASVLEKMNMSPEQRKYTEVIRKSGDSLLSLINDILDLSKLEAGKYEIFEEKVEIDQHIYDILDLLISRAIDKKIDLFVMIAPEVPAFIYSDGKRLRQILLNLIGNALKFIEEGEVRISVRLNQLKDKSVELLFEISDTGFGIDMSKKESLFKPFNRLLDSKTRKTGGTGLGLAISKKLVELLGGEIWFESVVDKGSTFYFTIKSQIDEDIITGEKPEYRTSDKRAGLQGKEIGFVSSCSNYVSIFENYSSIWGVSIKQVYISLEKQMIPKDLDSLDLLFLVMDDPIENNYLLLSEQIHEAYPELPLYGIVSFKEQIPELHLNYPYIQSFIQKPVYPSKIYNLICEYFIKNQNELGDDTGKEDEESQYSESLPLRILVAEDQEFNQIVIEEMLGLFGYTVDIVENGKLVLQSLDKKKYDLIFMDIRMPVMDGIEAISQINNIRDRDDLFVVAMTADVFMNSEQYYLTKGFDYVVPKPVTVADIKACFNFLKEKRKS